MSVGSGVLTLTLSAVMSVSILVNIAANFGFATCMRLLLLSACSKASLMMDSSFSSKVILFSSSA